jgi:hypothetical protein
LAILVLVPQSLATQEVIELYINGEKYVRDYPITLQDATALINSLVKMNNDLDNSFIEYQNINIKEKEQLHLKLNELEQNNNSLTSQINDLITQTDELTKLFDRYQKQSKNNFLITTSIGPSYQIIDNALGLNIALGAIHKMPVFNLFDFYAGLNVNTNIYYQGTGSKMSNLGIGAILGVFLK